MEKKQSSGISLCPMGIGINAGEVIVGNLGSDKHIEYTAIGHPVNAASRLCSIAEGGQILIGERSFELFKEDISKEPHRFKHHIKVKEKGKVKVKGIDAGVQTYEVLWDIKQ
jgi:adenylate cyclase